MLLLEHILKERLAVDWGNMNCMVLKEDVVDALTMVDEKGQKALSEPLISHQTVIVILKDRTFITVARITHKDVDKVTFCRRQNDHGEMKKW